MSVADASLSLYGLNGDLITSVVVALDGAPAPALLARLWREHLQGKPVRYAALREGLALRALYLNDDATPKRATRVPSHGTLRLRGNWLTRAVKVGAWGGGKLYLGPNLAVRQVDILPAEAWLAPVLMGFGAAEDTRAVPVKEGGVELAEVESGEGRLYARQARGRLTLYGAGNTPKKSLDAAVKGAKPATSDDFLWAIGAIPLVGRS